MPPTATGWNQAPFDVARGGTLLATLLYRGNEALEGNDGGMGCGGGHSHGSKEADEPEAVHGMESHMRWRHWIAADGVVGGELRGLGASRTGEVKEMAKDPVCGMDVEEKKAAATTGYEGKTYYFCATACKTTFVKAPEKYVVAGAAGKKECA